MTHILEAAALAARIARAESAWKQARDNGNLEQAVNYRRVMLNAQAALWALTHPQGEIVQAAGGDVRPLLRGR